MLKELLTNEPALPLAIDASAREVLTEVGNILLNACLGTFGNMLKVQVSFSVPHLNLDTLRRRARVAADQPRGRCATRWSSTPASSCATPRSPATGDRAQRRVARSADPRGRGVGAAAQRGEHARRRRRDAADRRDGPRGSTSSPTQGIFTTDTALVVRAGTAGSSARPASPADDVDRPAAVRGLSRSRRRAASTRTTATRSTGEVARPRRSASISYLHPGRAPAPAEPMPQSARIAPLEPTARDRRHDHRHRGRQRARRQRARAAQPDRRPPSGARASPRRRRG